MTVRAILPFLLATTIFFHLGALRSLYAQPFRVTVLDTSQRQVSFRGLSAPGAGVVWVSGSRGTIGRSTDGGAHWQWVNPAGFERRDFRDIEAFDDQTAIAMAVDSPGILLKTTDGGKQWRVVYEDHHPGVFLDAMAFRGEEGMCVGDPADGRFWLLHTRDRGEHWQLLPAAARPEAYPGEACFAASGTNIMMSPYAKGVLAFFVSGGMHSRLFMLSKDGEAPVAMPIPLLQGATMTGSNSILAMPRFPVVAGGDYEHPERSDSALYLMDNLLQPAQKSMSASIGYTSCLGHFGRDTLVACGLRGVALMTLPDAVLAREAQWTKIDDAPWHVLQQSQGGGDVYLAGPRGKIGVIKR